MLNKIDVVVYFSICQFLSICFQVHISKISAKSDRYFLNCTQGRIYSQQGPVQKKNVGAPSTMEADPIFPGKTGDFF